MHATEDVAREGDAADTTIRRARRVASDLTFRVADQVTLALQVAAADTAPRTAERLEVTLDGVPLRDPVDEVPGAHGGRVHVLRSGAGELRVAYEVTVGDTAVPDLAAGGSGGADTPPGQAQDVPIDAESLAALRQSRYCPSDELAGWATTQLAGLPDGPGLARAIGAWVHEHLDYELGVSRPTDTAIDTLMAGAGACRDFAHLTAALCRARGVPARLVAAYAPGLSPMDFHAVVEARTPAGWELVDSTRLAPRPSLVRIATGRDAADTAFATTVRGAAELVSSEIRATVDGILPFDDHSGPMAIA